jgi:hypothetical protein
MPDGSVPLSSAPSVSNAPGSRPEERVGWGFMGLYAAVSMGAVLLFLAPLLVSLSLWVNSPVGITHAPASLALVAGAGALLAMFANPFFGILVVAMAPNHRLGQGRLPERLRELWELRISWSRRDSGRTARSSVPRGQAGSAARRRCLAAVPPVRG